MNQNKKILTVIIPIRAAKHIDIAQRLSYCLGDDYLTRDLIEFLVVDDGSHPKAKQVHQERCAALNMQYLYIDSSDKNFSIARARNLGAQMASTEYIMFMDIDLYTYNNFYNDILNEIKINQLQRYNNDFIMVGVIYLTQEHGTELFLNTDKSLRKNLFTHKLLENDTKYIEKFSTGTSVNVFNRIAYLAHGGQDEEFEQWGYEDLEFNLRFIYASKKFPIPKDRFLDYKNFRTIDEYRGWKSVYRLYGDMTFKKGIVLFHIWHPVDHQSDYIQGKAKNQALFEKKHKEYVEQKIEPQALPSKDAGATLLFTKTNPFIYNRTLLPLLGKIYYQDENTLNQDTIISYIKENKIDRVLMFNPYATQQRLDLYTRLQQNNIPTIIAERGALRDSVFYDYSGFNAQSKSYDAALWDKALSKQELVKVKEYIQEEKELDISLEKQAQRKDLNILRKNLHIQKNKKVLFVPLQRPSDSVIKYFCGDIQSYDNFINLVQETVNTISDDWVVVIKKHPLEDKAATIENAIYSEDNVKDLLELCDAVLLINSGVGLLAMVWEKPVYYCGEVFYNDDRINKKVTSTTELFEHLYAGFSPKQETLYAFLYYLIEEFYSFGKFTTQEIPWRDGGRMTITKEIEFYQVRNIANAKLNFYRGNTARIKRDSILFDRYSEKTQEQTPSFYQLYQSYGFNSSKLIRGIKKIPLLGKALLLFKHKVLQWH